MPLVFISRPTHSAEASVKQDGMGRLDPDRKALRALDVELHPHQLARTGLASWKLPSLPTIRDPPGLLA